ncbi:MAG: methyltransferase domain-containing protein [Halioglobus sp.]
MAEVYDRDGYSAGYPEGIEQHFWNRARNSLVYRWLQPHLEEGELVMDVGCGIGLVVADLRSRGINARGVEQGAAPVFPGLEDQVQTACDLFELAPELKAEIRVIMLLDVIEHMQDSGEFLRQIASELPNCQTLLVTVPARMELWSDYDEHWGHHLRYNRAQLRAELAASGFAPVRTAYFFHWLYLVSLLMKILRIPKGTEFTAIRPGSPGALLHRVLGWVTRLENRLVPGVLVGSSLACIAKRVND